MTEQMTSTTVYGAAPRRRWRIVLAVAAVVLASGGAGVAVTLGFASDDPGPRPGSSSTADGTSDSGTSDEHESVFDEPAVAGPEYHEPTAADFEIELRTLSHECYGSAGCLVGFATDLTYFNDDGPLDPDKTYQITYEVHGVEDPPYIDTIEVTGDQYTASEDTVGTTSADVELTVEILSVTER